MKAIKINEIKRELLKESQKSYDVRYIELSTIYESPNLNYLVYAHLGYTFNKAPHTHIIWAVFNKDFELISWEPRKQERLDLGFDN